MKKKVLREKLSKENEVSKSIIQALVDNTKQEKTKKRGKKKDDK